MIGGRRRARHVLWGGRRGDLQLGYRTGLALLGAVGQEAAAPVVGVDHQRDGLWLWLAIA